MSPLQSRRCRWSGALAVAIAAAAVLLPSIARAQQAAPPLPQLVPKGTIGLASFDSAWLWDTTSGIRDIPEVQQMMAAGAQQTGISYENDILPWAGVVAGGLSSVSPTGPSGFVLIQVKDPTSFGSFLLKLKGIGGHAGGGLSLTEKTYAGTVYEEITGKGSTPKQSMQIDVAPVNGWVLIGFGSGTIEKLVNTYSQKSPSIDSVPAWHAALAAVPSDHVSMVGYDLAALMSSGMPMGGSPAVLDKSKFIFISACSADATSLRSEMIAIPETTAAQLYMKQMSTAIPPVKGLFLQQAPLSASATMFTNVAMYVRNALAGFAGTGGGPSAADMHRMQPYLDILYQFTGESGIGLTYKPDLGLGLAIGSQAETPAGAARAAQVIAARLKAQGMPLTMSGTTYSMDLSAMTVKGFPLTPVIAARGRWLLVSTSPAWIRRGDPTLSLPAGSDNSVMTGVGNFKWLSAVTTIIGNTPVGAQPAGHMIQGLITGLKLDDATWSSTDVIDPQGASSQGSFEIRNWDYKSAISNTAHTLADFARSMRQPATPKTTQRLPEAIGAPREVAAVR